MSPQANKNLGNAAFFAIKGLKKEIEEIKHELEILKTLVYQGTE